jgi:hypothetical protein
MLRPARLSIPPRWRGYTPLIASSFIVTAKAGTTTAATQYCSCSDDGFQPSREGRGALSRTHKRAAKGAAKFGYWRSV